ncbi:MAG: hydroxyacylglutathione hydrolase [Methylotenera sp.]|uniref:hydroxyacylglutathione hydrolase n=1 Tax=Methylotenera sp. TaxID=2051956 RepID=UPI00248901CA|nr:hydroxyacylglutathione hydrolase [Methylotenera sp.]MDI1309565.1 hydroxyacylglutathione hydrolase [Methylotenera sp.]
MIDSMNHNLQIIPIPAFKDNYIWLMHNGAQCTVVDPGDAAPVIEALKRLNLILTTILITHHHHDHIGGVTELLEAFPKALVYAPALEQYDFNHIAINETNTIELKDLNIPFTILDLPGHTLGHIAYYSAAHKLLFCGDTLFGAGCGRLFEGTPTQMYHSLQKLAVLPSNTAVYSTHEYTLHNLSFALMFEPHNHKLLNRQKSTQELRGAGIPSLPSTIELELATNPFLRCNNKEIHSALKLTSATEIEIFSKLRELRNHY